MNIFKTITQILGLADAVMGWRSSLRALNAKERAKVAVYCDTVADTLARTGEALERLSDDTMRARSRDKAGRDMRRELARLAGNVRDLADLLDGHLDGRKIAGVKRRLEGIVEQQTVDTLLLAARQTGEVAGLKRRMEMLADAEGVFRALGDGLKV